MKKFLKILTLLLICLINPSNVYALYTTEANEKIDLTKNCSLTLNYYYNDYDFENTIVEIYHIASVSSDFRYQLSSNFLSYPIKINGIKTEQEWTALEQTLNAYINADSIETTISTSINDNKVEIKNLKCGLYFVKTDKVDTKNYTLIFDSFLLSVPNLKEDGTWNYDVLVYPKAEEYIPKYEKINYTIIKEWNDDPSFRPESIEVEIYEDGIFFEEQILSNDNNWTYEWTTDDDGSEWTIVERNIPEGYEVSIMKNNKSFIIVNTDPNYEEFPPQTGDNIKLYFYLLFGSLIGFALLIISLIMQKKYVK